MSKIAAHFFVLATIILAVYSQIIIKWQVNRTSKGGDLSRFQLVLALFQNPWVLSGILATFLSGVTWMLAMTRLDISYAYMFMSLVFVLVPTAGYVFFDEPVTQTKIIGAFLVMAGVCVVSIGRT